MGAPVVLEMMEDGFVSAAFRHEKVRNLGNSNLFIGSPYAVEFEVERLSAGNQLGAVLRGPADGGVLARQDMAELDGAVLSLLHVPDERLNVSVVWLPENKVLAVALCRESPGVVDDGVLVSHCRGGEGGDGEKG